MQTIIIATKPLIFGELCTVLANAGIVSQGAFEQSTHRFHMRANGSIDKINKIINYSSLASKRSEFIITPYVGPNENL